MSLLSPSVAPNPWLLLADRLSPPPVDVFGLLGYTPNAKQSEFHEATEYDVLYGGARGGGKALDARTPIPTPTGWTTMGEVDVGDLVFDADGIPTTVLACSPLMLGHECYRVTFSDCSVIDADAEHLWWTFTIAERAALLRRSPEFRARRREARPSRATGHRSAAFTAAISRRNSWMPPPTKATPLGSVRTTAEIRATVAYDRRSAGSNHSIPVAGPLELPAAELPIPPYTLGAWLGDGDSAGPGITVGPGDEQTLIEIEADGYGVSPRSARMHYVIGDRVFTERANGRRGWVRTFTTQLRNLGVLANKHIPSLYLRAAVDQRLALLQGLIDTDGYVNPRGHVSFTSTNPRLALDFVELVNSLGIKAVASEGRAKLNGKDCGPVWDIKFVTDLQVCRLGRKRSRQKAGGFRGTHAQRYILSVEQIPSVPVRCITVDSPGHLYLAGRSMIPTHNSYSLTVEAIKQAIRVPGLRCAVFRRSYPELYESILSNALVKLDFARALGARWNADAKVLTFPNQSSIRFRYAETLPDASHYQGGEYGLLCLDERAQFAPGVVEVLREGLRSGDGGRSVVGIRSTCNPGGASHTVVKTDYIEATDHGKNVVLDEQGRTIRFIPATVWDNIEHVSQAYVAELMSIKDPARRRAMLDGDFSAFGGQVFEEWNYDRHVVPRPREALPESWERWCGIDHGWRSPWAVLWLAKDGDQRIWVYRELYRTMTDARVQARMIMDMEAEAGEEYVRHVIDPSTASKDNAGPSIYEMYGQEGLGCLKADNDRLGGLELVHQALSDGPLCRWHAHQKALGKWHQDTCPMLHVFDGTCPNLVRTLPDLPYDKTRIEDVDTKVEDHAYDALRYALKSMFGPGGPVDYDDEDGPVRAYKVLEMVPGAGTAHSPFVTNGNGNGSSNGH